MKLIQARYAVVKFVPDLIKNEHINVGLILHSPSECYIRSEFSTKKVKIISKYNPDINIDVVNGLIEDLEANFNNSNYILRNQCYGEFTDEKLIYNLFAAHSNQIQFSKPKGLITYNLDVEFEKLFNELVFVENVKVKRKNVEERTMRSKLKRAFNERNLIQKNIITENHIEIGQFGEEIKIDFRFLNGKVNLVQNLSFDLKSRDSLDYAKIWLKNFEEIKENALRRREDKKINVIYCPPQKQRKNENFNRIIDCLGEASDQLIDYQDDEKLKNFINQVQRIAHN